MALIEWLRRKRVTKLSNEQLTTIGEEEIQQQDIRCQSIAMFGVVIQSD